MAKYNIYRIKSGKAKALREKLTSVSYEQTAEVEQGDYKLTSYFTPLPKQTEIWWLTQYAAFFSDYKTKKNTVYSGAIIAESKKTKQAFLIALGKTHFYVQEFIDYAFGLKMAERIGKEQGAKLKSSKHLAGQTSKSMISFSGDTTLSFSPGEATDYVKLKAADADTWGKAYVHFGTSVQFGSIKWEPYEMNELLANLEIGLKADAAFSLPRMLPVKDEDQITKLDADLSNAIEEENGQLCIVDFELYGVDFVFSQQTHVKLEYEGQLSEDIPELDIAAVKKFADDYSIDLGTSLRDIKAKLYVNESSKYTADLIKLLDFVGDDNSFLYRGEWYIFSDTFLNNLRDLIQTVTLEPLGMEFGYTEHEAWKIAHIAAEEQKGTKKKDRVTYPERYAIDKIVKNGTNLKDIDRSFDYKKYSGKRLAVEVSDIYDVANEEISVVKIGEAKDFSYAFDQAALTLNLLKANQYEMEDGTSVLVRRIRLSLLSSKVNTPKVATDIESLSFQIKLGELMNLAKEKNVKLIVSFAKYTKPPKPKKVKVTN
jgi:uncharacterized protein (TIGR04141 family)